MPLTVCPEIASGRVFKTENAGANGFLMCMAEAEQTEFGVVI